jgi:hypothetical protein
MDRVEAEISMLRLALKHLQKMATKKPKRRERTISLKRTAKN